MIKSTVNQIKINLNRNDEKTKSIRRRLTIDDNNDKKNFTI